jgi:hypothetical protein
VIGGPPDGQVFGEGLRPTGTNLIDLLEHVSSAPRESGYVTTSRNVPGVQEVASEDDPSRELWSYEIVVPGGIDVNATLGSASPHPDRNEVVFPGGIAGRYIRGARRLPAGEYRHNPHYRPGVTGEGPETDPGTTS